MSPDPSGIVDHFRFEGWFTDAKPYGAELDHLAFSARLITLEQLIRFLTDFLNGDVCYKVHRENHNLDRCRTQLKMLRDMEQRYEQMVAIVDRYR